MNTITLDNYPIYDPPPELESLAGQYNSITLHSGASRYGTGRFLMRENDYVAMARGTENGVLNLRFSPKPNGSGDWGFPVLLAGAVPLSQALSDDTNNNLMEVFVFDLRCTLTDPSTHAINVQKQGFPLSGGVPEFYPATTNSGSEYTWTQAIAALHLDGITWPTLPDWKPRNLIFDAVPLARMLDDVAARLGLVVGFDPAASSHGSLAGLKVFAPSATVYDQAGLMQEARPYLLQSNTTLRNLKHRIPGTIHVTFQVFDRDHPDDPYAQRLHTVDYTHAAGDPTLTQALHVGEYIAIYSGGGIVNAGELEAVAQDVAARHIKLRTAALDEREYAGIWPFKIDGSIRGVRWISDAHGARTVIRINNDLDFSPMEQSRRSLELLSNQLVVGLGNSQVGLGVGGTRFVWSGTTLADAKNPKDLTYADEHPQAVDTTSQYDGQWTWAQDTANAYDGIKMTIVVGEAYHDDGDETWYEYRKDIVLPRWAVTTVGETYRVTIDQPEDCTLYLDEGFF